MRRKLARWIVACTLGASLGSTLSAFLSSALSALGPAAPPWLVMCSLPAMGALEGLLLGLAQQLAPLPARAADWIVRTTLGMAAGWSLGALASFFESPEMARWEGFVLALLLGGVLGAALGISQGGALARDRDATSRRATARTWALVQAGAWATALGLSFLLTDLIPQGASTAAFALLELGKGALVGLCVGALSAPAFGDLDAPTRRAPSSPAR